MVKCSIKGCNKQAKVFQKKLAFCKEHAKEIGLIDSQHEVFPGILAEVPKEMGLGLTIRNLSLEDIKGLMRHVRDIEQENPDRLIFCWIKGLEHKTQEEVIKILEEIFPRVQVGG